MKIGYVRVSKDDQNLDLQLDALSRVGCEQIFTDQGVSRATIEREGLSRLSRQPGKVTCWLSGSWTAWRCLLKLPSQASDKRPARQRCEVFQERRMDSHILVEQIFAL
jgi:Resolvase, N terminal domain